MITWDLVFAHRYEEAVRRYKAQLKEEPADSGIHAGMGTALLCLGKLKEALIAFNNARSLAMAELPASSPYSDDIGTIQWLLGKRTEALQTFRQAVDGLLDGSIQYADITGGVEEGLLLYYAGVTLKDKAAQNHALGFFKELSISSRFKYFPGPIAFRILGHASFTDVLKAATEVEGIDRAMEVAKSSLHERKQLCLALFYEGILARAQGKEKECLQLLKQCSSLENPIIVPEWYLARAEST